MPVHAGANVGEPSMAEKHPTALTIIKRKQVEHRTGLSRSTIYQKIAEGTFPKAIRLSAHAVGWLSHEIDEWIERQVKLSRSAVV
jgi:prophage regulatory protein